MKSYVKSCVQQISAMILKPRICVLYSQRCLSQAQHSFRESDLFVLEQKRQREAVGRLEKIEVKCHCPGNGDEETTLVMNKNVSTPFECAKHFNENIMNKTAVALINGETLWHMHKPIPDSCNLEFLNYTGKHLNLVNKVFWRSCSYLLGATVATAFKKNVDVQLHSFPIPNVKSGSFIYDVQLSLKDWRPSISELRVLSLEMIKFCQNDYPFECLDVSAETALMILENSPHKTLQIPDIAANNGGKVTLFRVGPHVDISKGPMIGNTNQLGRASIANVIKLETDIPGHPIYRFQGVALPSSIILSHFAYAILEQRARTLNPARIPGTQGITTEETTFIAEMAN